MWERYSSYESCKEDNPNAGGFTTDENGNWVPVYF